VTVGLDDVAGGTEVTVSIPPGSGDLLGFFGNVVNESLVPGMGVSSGGVVTQWQFRANQVWRVGFGNNMLPVLGWDFGLKLDRWLFGAPVENATFTLTGISVAQLVGAANQGWIFGVRVQPASGIVGGSKIGMPVGTPPLEQAPTIEITEPQDGAVVGSTVAVAGTVSGTSPTVTVNGQAATVSGGTWSTTLSLADGPHTLTATATNAAGSASDVISVTVDTTGPAITIASPAAGSVTSQTPIAVSGNVSDASAVAFVQIDGATFPVSAGAFTGTASLAEGANTITVTAEDALGNPGQASVAVTLDTIAPAVVIATPPDGTLTTQGTIPVEGSVSDAGAIQASTVNGQAVALDAGGAFSTTVTLSLGANPITASATDAAGNVGTASATVTRGELPAVAIASPAADFLTSQATVEVTGTAAGATAVSVNGVTATLTGNDWTASVPLLEGANTLTATATNAFGSAQAVVSGTLDSTAPAVSIQSPADGATLNTSPVTVTGAVLDASAFTVTVNGVAASISGSAFTAEAPLSPGSNTLSAVATDAAGNVGQAQVTVAFQLPPLAVTITMPADGFGTTEENVAVAGVVSDASASVTVNGVPASLTGTAFQASVAVSPGTNFITAQALRGADTASDQIAVVRVTTPPPAPPPDPATVAPPTDLTSAVPLSDGVAFLYTGPDAIQTGVDPLTIDRLRAVVLRGQVLTRSGDPLASVSISVDGHPEYGETLSRADGHFDLVANGGSLLTLRYEREGFLTAQRQVETGWLDYELVPDVVLVPRDPAVTAVNVGGAAALQVARGSIVSDADGARQATVLFPAGTTASLLLANGTLQPVSSLQIRLTEFTVGSSGEAAMPAPLPPTSAYTYAVEVDADEAVAADAREIRLSQPASVYVENFLGFPTGIDVPVGLYSRQQAAWVPSDDGRVIEILSETAGAADLDIDGSGSAASAPALAELGVTSEERIALANLYEPGQSLWRMPVPHFTPIDANWPTGVPGDAQAWSGDPSNNKPTDRPGCSQGSIIECQNQILREEITLVGTPFSLHYASDRVPGRAAARTLRIPLSSESVPASLKRIEVEMRVAGQRIQQAFLPLPNQTTEITWNGLDAYGRPVQGAAPATVEVAYIYDAVYTRRDAPDPYPNFRGFARVEIAPIDTPPHQRSEARIRRRFEESLGPWDARGVGLGGWTLSAHHAYDPAGRVLYRGDGSRQSTADTSRTVQRFAGSGATGILGDGGPATAATILPTALVTGPDGSLYIANPPAGGALHNVIRRVLPDGTIVRFAGRTTAGAVGDGGPALNATIYMIQDMAFGPDGSLYVTEGFAFGTNGNRVRRIAPNGIITTVTGNGARTSTGDGGPASAATIGFPRGLAIAPDGTLYVMEQGADTGVVPRIRRITPDGIIDTFAGGGMSTADGAFVTDVSVLGTSDLLAEPDGSLVFVQPTVVRRISPDGIVRTIAGGGTPADGIGDGGPATSARLLGARSVARLADGTLLVSEYRTTTPRESRIRAVDPGGKIHTLIGGVEGTTRIGGFAPSARLEDLRGLAVGPTDTVYVAALGSGGSYVFSLVPPLAGFSFDSITIPAKDASEVYEFTLEGQHLRTLDGLTGATRLTFGYDGAGRLAAIEDADGNQTEIQHDASGRPTTIVGPYGQVTGLAANDDGFLASVANPAGESHALGYHGPSGLLASFGRPGGATSTFLYDALGRLSLDTDPAGGFTDLARTDLLDGHVVTSTTALGVVADKSIRFDADGTQERVNTDGAGLDTVETIGADGVEGAESPDGTLLTRVLGPDPRFGGVAPVVEGLSIATPGGLLFERTQSRTATLDPVTKLLQVQTDTITVNGRTSTVEYDGTMRTLIANTAEGRLLVDTLDALGRLAETQVDGLEAVRLGYDARGRLATLGQGAGAAERLLSFAYNARGELASVTDPLLRSVSFEYDDAGRVTRQVLPDSRFIDFTYDARGNLTSLKPPGQPAHVFRYTLRDEEGEYEPPDVVPGDPRTFYTYDLDRNLIQVDRPDSTSIVLGYDTAGRLSTVTAPRGTTTQSYHPSTGNVSTIVAPGGEMLAFAYDGALVTSTTWGGSVAGSVSQTYDDDLRVATQSVNGGSTTAFAYDDDGLLVQAGAEILTRDPLNGLLAGTTLGSVSTSQSFNGFGELASDSSSAGYMNTYTRDKLGRITQKVETIGGVTTTYGYDYDLAGRLEQVTVNGAVARTYAYDPNGNRLSVTDSVAGVSSGTYDAQDRLVSYGASTYAYNAAGDLTTKTGASGTTQYEYDALGNLVSAQLPDGRSIGYVIDGQNRRVGKRVNGSLVQGFLYEDQLEPVAELDGAGNVVSRFVYGSRENTPDYMVRGGAMYRILSDHLGSPRLVVDASTGAVAQRIDYDEFGRVTLDTNPGFQPFGFAGGIDDRDTSLVRFGARDYDAETGRWTAKDPIRFQATDWNLYRYVAGNPISFVDPSGEIGPLVAIGLAFIGSGAVGAGGTALAFGVAAQLDPSGVGSQGGSVAKATALAAGGPALAGAAFCAAGAAPPLLGAAAYKAAANPQGVAAFANAAGDFAGGYLVTGPASTPAGAAGVVTSLVVQTVTSP
jgi:RHS repeat-associated protein